MISANLSAIFYLISGVLFILSIKRFVFSRNFKTRKFFGIIGMVIAITVTFLSVGNFSTGFIYVIIFFIIWRYHWSIYSF